MCTICKECVATKVRSSQLGNVHAANVDTQQWQEAVPSVWLTVAGWGVTHTVYVCITAFLLKLCKLLVCCYGTD